jgi:hypothetical protein
MSINVFPAETFPFDTLTDIQRSAIFMYFVYKCPFADPPPCFMTGENVRSFRTFANELFIPRSDHMIKSADVFEAITLYFPCFDFTRKELIKY